MYNASKYVHRCITSIQNQKYDNIEIILVDDGSKDNTVNIVKEIQQTESRIKLLTQGNQGPAMARNNGLNNVSGDYVIFVDVDDYIGEGFLSSLCSFLDAGADWLSFAHFEGCNSNYSRTQCKDAMLENENIPTLYVNALDAGMTIDYLWDKVYNAEIIRKNSIKFPDIRTGEDTIFNLRYAQCCRSILVSSCAYYYYQKNESSISLGYRSSFLDLIHMLRQEIVNMESNQRYPDFRFVEWSEDHIIQGDVYGLIDNFIYCKTPQLTCKKLYSIMQVNLFQNETLLNELHNYKKCRGLNQKVIKTLLNNRLFVLCFIYSNIVGFIKRMA